MMIVAAFDRNLQPGFQSKCSLVKRLQFKAI
jgi:hypothetical protein